MWLYHGRINEKHFARFTDTLTVQGKTLAETAVHFNDFDGKMPAKWRSFSAETAESHNIYPAIDISFDEDTLRKFENYLFDGKPVAKLTNCVFRITDYGYLNVMTNFEVENSAALEAINKLQVNFTRKISDFIPTLKAVEDELIAKNYLYKTDDYFGIPNKIKDYILVNKDDTYMYQDLTILSGADVKTGRAPSLQDAEKIERFEVCDWENSPIICVENQPTADEIFDIIEPVNIPLAEVNLYESVSSINYAIVKLMNEASFEKKRRFFSKNKTAGAYNQFTSSDLRKFTINTHYALHLVTTRKAAITAWQLQFLRKYRDTNPYDENRADFEKSEEIIAKVIEEKTQESEKGHSNTLEIMFMFLSAITIYSTFVDIVSFFDKNFDNLWLIELRIFLGITFVLAVVFFWIIGAKRKK